MVFEAGGRPFDTNRILNAIFDPTTNKIAVDTEIGISGVTIDTTGLATEATLSTRSTEATLLTRASESTLSGIASDIDNVQAKFDTSLSSRASESTLSSLNSKDFATESTLSGVRFFAQGIKDDTTRINAVYDSTNNALYFREVSPDALNPSNVTIVSGGSLIIAANANRHSVLIFNNSTNSISIGTSGSTVFPLAGSNGVSVKSTVAIYGYPLTGIAADVRVLEESY